MARFSLSRLAVAAAASGAVLFGAALGGMADVDRDLQAAVAAPPATTSTLVVDRHGGCDDAPRRPHDRESL